jgi:putative peptide zinc metalloprotease protein
MARFLPTIARPLALRLRPDVVATPVEMSGATTWVVHDPLTLEHFQFSAEEHALLVALRQRVSIAELQRIFARQFPPRSISPEAVWDFVRRLHDAGLLIADAHGQGSELLTRERRDRTRRWSLAWMQILAIRFRGFDPDTFLTTVHRRFRWLISPAAMLVVAAIVIYAISIIFGHLEEFRARLPELTALADVRNLPWLLAAIGGAKVLHELGHAFACKHFGGQVRELGLMLLAFSPCLYCDVSDSWRFASKWRRIAVAGAGMFVELCLAAVATIIWWHAQPGIVQLVALNVMLVSSVGTLLVNGNPLLRYDGYYILSDLVEVPNLWQRSRDTLRQFTSRALLGESPREDSLVPSRHRGWLAAYALASKLCVAMVCVAIVWGLTVLLYPLRLQNLAYALGMTMLAGVFVQPMTSGVRLLRNPAKRSELPSGRLATISAITMAALVAILAWPVDYHVQAPFVLLPEGAERIYATIDGTLTNAIAPGESVSVGMPVATLQNSAVELELRRVEGDHRLQRLRVEHLERLRGFDPESGSKLPAARAALATLETRLNELQVDARRLKLTANQAGIVLPAPRISRPSRDNAKLPAWPGSLLDESNLGARVEPGTLVCLVGDPSKLVAVLLAEDTDAPHLRPGQTARLQLTQLPGTVLNGKVVEVARHEMRDTKSEGVARGDFASMFAGLVAPGEPRAYFQVQVQFDPPDRTVIWGGRGIAKVTAERVTLGQRMLRFVARTFRLPMGYAN